MFAEFFIEEPVFVPVPATDFKIGFSFKEREGSKMKKYNKPLEPSEVNAVKDEDIDFSDIPELDESFWANAKLVEPDRTEQVTLRIERSVLNHFKSSGKGYQTRINQVLESYVRAKQDSK